MCAGTPSAQRRFTQFPLPASSPLLLSYPCRKIPRRLTFGLLHADQSLDLVSGPVEPSLPARDKCRSSGLMLRRLFRDPLPRPLGLLRCASPVHAVLAETRSGWCHRCHRDRGVVTRSDHGPNRGRVTGLGAKVPERGVQEGFGDKVVPPWDLCGYKCPGEGTPARSPVLSRIRNPSSSRASIPALLRASPRCLPNYGQDLSWGHGRTALV